MFDALTHSDLSAIHDIALARSQLELAFDKPPSARAGDRVVLTGRLAERIGQLGPDARVELLALVRLGRDGRGAKWLVLLDEARGHIGDGIARHLAATPALDELIERGLIALRDQSSDTDEFAS